MIDVHDQKFNKLFTTKLIDKLGLYPLAFKIGGVALAYRLFRKDELKDSEEYFKNNIDRVQNIMDNLQDECSRKTYQSMIAYRCHCRVKDFPYFDFETQYFPNIVTYHADTVFVDCGAFNGDTMKVFKEKVPEYKGYVAFEPEEDNYNALVSEANGDERIACVKSGVGREEKTLSFVSGGSGSRIIGADEESAEIAAGNRVSRIHISKIDDIPEARDATHIKMDIEGAEMDALEGGKGDLWIFYFA